jgi:hypothetical protein
MRNFRSIPLIGIVALSAATVAYAQRAPAIPGVTGSIATPETVKDEYKAANKIAVAAEDGIEHVFPAGKGELSDLREGTTVAIYYESTATEGTVSNVTRKSGEITVRYDNGRTEKLTLAEKAAVEPGKALKNQPQGNTRVVVYYSNAARGRIARYFTPKS